MLYHFSHQIQVNSYRVTRLQHTSQPRTVKRYWKCSKDSCIPLGWLIIQLAEESENSPIAPVPFPGLPLSIIDSLISTRKSPGTRSLWTLLAVLLWNWVQPGDLSTFRFYRTGLAIHIQAIKGERQTDLRPQPLVTDINIKFLAMEWITSTDPLTLY